MLVLLLYVTQKAKTTISLSYKGNLDDETASRFSEVQEALEGLASSEGIWSLPVSSKLPKAGEVAPTPEREPARVGLLPTPGIKADVPVWGIEAGDGTHLLLPGRDALLQERPLRARLLQRAEDDPLLGALLRGGAIFRPTRRSWRRCGASAGRTEAPTPATRTTTSRSPSSSTTCST